MVDHVGHNNHIKPLNRRRFCVDVIQDCKVKQVKVPIYGLDVTKQVCKKRKNMTMPLFLDVNRVKWNAEKCRTHVEFHKSSPTVLFNFKVREIVNF